jgi:hypothetical protein
LYPNAASATSRPARVLLAVFSGVAGVILVAAAFKVDSLNWMVDSPGWLVSRFVSIDLHEGEGAFGFFFAIFLSWACWSVVVWLLLFGIRRLLPRA